MDNLKELFDVANLPTYYRSKQLQDYGVPGVTLKNYFNGYYADDRRAGYSVTLTGQTGPRVRLFPMFVRCAILANTDVLYTTLVGLRNAVCEDGFIAFNRFSSCELLCIAGMYQEKEPFPFSVYDRANIENFLMARSDNQMKQCYDSDTPFIEAEWWSRHFREHQKERMRTLTI